MISVGVCSVCGVEVGVVAALPIIDQIPSNESLFRKSPSFRRLCMRCDGRACPALVCAERQVCMVKLVAYSTMPSLLISRSRPAIGKHVAASHRSMDGMLGHRHSTTCSSRHSNA